MHVRSLGLRVVPNLISIARLALVPLTLYWLLTGAERAALTAFVVAGVSDAVDGYVARRWRLETPLGKLLDPLADKALLAGTTMALGWLGSLPIWLVLLIVSRDVLIILGVAITWLLGRPIPAAPSGVSKANTVAQLVLCSAVLLELAVDWSAPLVIDVLVPLVVLLTVLSAATYAWRWTVHMRGHA